ncbi:MAG: glyoxalase [Firmicutes bacterium]|nr:glyoxalase [Bacillota bacterium]
MSDKEVKLANACPILISEDVKKTVKYYVEKLGFTYAKHYEHIESFAALYRDSVELVVVQSKFGNVKSNTKRYGAGYDVYIDPDTVKGVDILYQEFVSKGVKIFSKPSKTDYGSYEFVLEDIDGRLIGIGRIYDYNTFFLDSDRE